MPSYYEIDGQDVNSRPDWRHTPPVVGLSCERYEGFPGSGAVFMVLGRKTGVSIDVTGWLEGSSFTSLHNEIGRFNDLRADLNLHRVTVQGQSYDGCRLAGQAFTGPHVVFSDGTRNRWIRVPVRHSWRQLFPGGAA